MQENAKAVGRAIRSLVILALLHCLSPVGPHRGAESGSRGTRVDASRPESVDRTNRSAEQHSCSDLVGPALLMGPAVGASG